MKLARFHLSNVGSLIRAAASFLSLALSEIDFFFCAFPAPEANRVWHHTKMILGKDIL